MPGREAPGGECEGKANERVSPGDPSCRHKEARDDASDQDKNDGRDET